MVNDFSLFISCGKNVICLAFLEKRTGETAWMVAFVNSRRLMRVRCVVIPLRMACVQKSPISFVARGKVTFPVKQRKEETYACRILGNGLHHFAWETLENIPVGCCLR